MVLPIRQPFAIVRHAIAEDCHAVIHPAGTAAQDTSARRHLEAAAIMQESSRHAAVGRGSAEEAR